MGFSQRERGITYSTPLSSPLSKMSLMYTVLSGPCLSSLDCDMLIQERGSTQILLPCRTKGQQRKQEMEFLEALEASGFSMWVKESSTAYVAVLAFHTVGLTFLVGISGATAMRILGVAPTMPLAPMKDFFPLMHVGFLINLLTGSVLLCLYPTDYVVDPVIYIKLAAVVVALVMINQIRAHVFDQGDPETQSQTKAARRFAATLLSMWLIAIVAGRVTAYTLPTRLQTAAAVLVVVGAALLVIYVIGRNRGWIKSP